MNESDTSALNFDPRGEEKPHPPLQATAQPASESSMPHPPEERAVPPASVDSTTDSGGDATEQAPADASAQVAPTTNETAGAPAPEPSSPHGSESSANLTGQSETEPLSPTGKRRRRRRRRKPRNRDASVTTTEGAVAGTQAGAMQSSGERAGTEQASPQPDATQPTPPQHAPASAVPLASEMAAPAPSAEEAETGGSAAGPTSAALPNSLPDGASAPVDAPPSDPASAEPSPRELARLQRIETFLRERGEPPVAPSPGGNSTATAVQPATDPQRSRLEALEQQLVAFLQSRSDQTPEQRDALAQAAFEAAPILDVLDARLRSSKGVATPTGGDAIFELVRRLETRDIEPERMLETLAVLSETVARDSWLEWMLALTENRDTRRALEALGTRLPDPWRPLHQHARILFQVVVRGQTNQAGAHRLAQAVRALLTTGAKSLHSRPVAVRQRLVRLAVTMRPSRATTATLEQLLTDLRNAGAALELELELVRNWLVLGDHDKAQAKLDELAAARGDHPDIGPWRRALASTRYGDVALIKSRVKSPLDCEHPLRPGFSFIEQRDVWLRVGATEDAPTFIAHVEAHRRADVPGVSAICEAGFTRARRPYVAYQRIGDNAKYALFPPRGLERARALGYAKQLTQLAYALGRTGLVLPDADLGRLELSSDDRLWLVESWGAQVESPESAMEKALGLLRQWQIALLADSPNFELPREARDNLEHAADFRTINATLDGLIRGHYWAG